MKKIILIYVLIFLPALLFAEDISYILQNSENNYCSILLSKLEKERAFIGNQESLSLLNLFLERTKNKALWEKAFCVKDKIEFKTGLRESSEYYKNNEVVKEGLLLETDLRNGYNDLFDFNIEAKRKRKITCDLFGFFNTDLYVENNGKVYFLEINSLSGGKDVRIDSNLDYIVYSGKEVIAKNTGSFRRDEKYISSEKIQGIISIHFFSRKNSYLRVVHLKNKVVKPEGLDSDPFLSSFLLNGEYLNSAEYLCALNSPDAEKYYEMLSGNKEAEIKYCEYLFNKNLHSFRGSSIISSFNEKDDIDERVILLKAEKLFNEDRAGEAVSLLAHKKENPKIMRKLVQYFFLLKRYTQFSTEALSYLQKNEDDVFIKNLYLDYLIMFSKNEAVEYANEILRQERDEEVARKLYDVLFSSGRYSEAAVVAKQFFSSANLYLGYSKALFRNGKSEEAKNYLLNYVSLREDPRAYQLLAEIESSCGRPNDMFLMKKLNIVPGDISLSSYLISGDKLPRTSFSDYREERKIKSFFNDYFLGKDIVDDYLFRSEMFLVFKDMSLRSFKEELVYIKNESDADDFGEIRLPAGTSEIISARVYLRDGSFTDSYRLNKTGGGTFLTIHGLKKDSLLHVAFETASSKSTLFESSHLSFPLSPLQEYWRSCAYAEAKIINRSSKNITLFNSMKLPVQTKYADNETVTSFNVSSLSAQKREFGSGHYSKSLLYFGFWTSFSDEDFFNAFFIDKQPESLKIPDSFEGKKGLDAVNAVYSYIQTHLRTAGTLDFSIGDFNELLYSGKADEEDKAFIAKYFFDKMKIHSYFVLVHQDFADDKTFFSDRFYKPLLLVELDGRSIYLDFYGRYFDAGTISADCENRTAVVFKEVPENIKITFSQKSQMKTRWEIDSVKGVFSSETELTGDFSEIKKFFSDKRYSDRNMKEVLESYKCDLTMASVDFPDAPFLKIISTGEISGNIFDTGRSLILRPFLRQSSVANYVSSDDRISPVFLRESVWEEDQYNIILPKLYLECEAEIDREFVFGDAVAKYTFTKKRGEIFATCSQKVFFPKREIPAEKYGDFVLFCSEIRKFEKTQVVLKQDGKDNR